MAHPIKTIVNAIETGKYDPILDFVVSKVKSGKDTTSTEIAKFILDDGIIEPPLREDETENGADAEECGVDEEHLYLHLLASFTSPFFAVAKGGIEMLKLFIEHDVLIYDDEDEEEEDPFLTQMVEWKCDMESIRYLHGLGYELDSSFAKMAAWSGRLDALRFADEHGELHCDASDPVESEDIECVRYVLSKGVKVTYKACQIAIQQDLTDILDLLLNHAGEGFPWNRLVEDAEGKPIMRKVIEDARDK